jgi:hypothetical protein
MVKYNALPSGLSTGFCSSYGELMLSNDGACAQLASEIQKKESVKKVFLIKKKKLECRR